MDPQSLVEAIESAPQAEVRDRFRAASGVAGFSRAYFARVAELMGSQPDAAIRLASHWKFLRRYGDERAIAYRVRGALERMQGRWAASARSFIRAGEEAADSVEKLSFQVGAVDGLARAGRLDQAEQLGRQLHQGLTKLGAHSLAARVALNLGNVALWRDRHAEAVGWLGPAREALLEAGLSMEAAASALGRSTGLLYCGSAREAEELARQAEREFDDLDSPHYRDLALMNVAQALLLRGRADEAVDILLSVRVRLAEHEPYEAARAYEFIGDAYVRLNLWTEAADSYRVALRETTLGRIDRAAVRFSLAQVLSMEDDPGAATALRSSERALRAAGAEVMALLARLERARLLVRRGRPGQAAQLCESVIAEATKIPSPYALAHARVTLAEARPSDDESLAGLLEQVSQEEWVDLEWRLHRAHAERALLGGRDSEALGHFRLMFETILRSRVLLRSLQSRAAFLRDKSDALRRYLSLLLRQGGPDAVAEALEVIARSRSAALLDEIASGSHALGPEIQATLRELREQFETPEDPVSGGGARLASGGRLQAGAFQRRWVEASRMLVSGAATLPRVAGGVTVFAEVQDALYALQADHAIRLPLCASELEARLRWLQFELMAPQACRDAEAGCVLQMLNELRSLLIEPWLHGEGGALMLSPDGLLWRVPWQALTTREVMLLPTPALAPDAESLTLTSKPRIALWCGAAHDLPHVEQEAEDFIGRFPQALVCRSAAEARASLGGSFDLVHVAAHAKLNSQNPMFSYLQFPDGRLLATEIARSD
ncbi:MAG TPA: CHAT domain-containing protein, partial [Fimbriimonadaceae bacterium]|nr:CHAT domain-containing protein [Fimbriimonadaceae bacterium]